MDSSQKGGKSKSSRSSSSKSKKGGNFLGSVSELFVPTGWESFATAAGLLAIDRVDAAFRRSRNSSKKQKGGADTDAHLSTQELDEMQGILLSDTDSSFPDSSGPDMMNGGGANKKSKTKTTKTKTKTTKSKTKTKTTTKSKTNTAAKKKNKKA
jgi:hypothetical protein